MIAPPTNTSDMEANATYLTDKLDDQMDLVSGYVAVWPRSSTLQDNQLWIIGAVLAPLAFLCIVFWLCLLIYYTCVNPRGKSNNSKSQPKVPPKKDLYTSDKTLKITKQTQTKSTTKVTPAENDEESMMVAASKSSKKYGIENLVSESLSARHVNNSSSRTTNSHDLSLNIDTNNEMHQRNELEKWRNKQRQREQNFRGDALTADARTGSGSFKGSNSQMIGSTQQQFAHNHSRMNNGSLNNNPSSSSSHMHVSNMYDSKFNGFYNPYQQWNEYDMYLKDDFLFEPLPRAGGKRKHNSNEAYFNNEETSGQYKLHKKTTNHSNLVSKNNWSDEHSSEFKKADSGSASPRRKSKYVTSSKETTTNVSVGGNSSRSLPRYDEIDLANRFQKTANRSQELINSIKKEIRILQTMNENEAQKGSYRSRSNEINRNKDIVQ